jgi:hypothetical protein
MIYPGFKLGNFGLAAGFETTVPFMSSPIYTLIFLGLNAIFQCLYKAHQDLYSAKFVAKSWAPFHFNNRLFEIKKKLSVGFFIFFFI